MCEVDSGTEMSKMRKSYPRQKWGNRIPGKDPAKTLGLETVRGIGGVKGGDTLGAE